MSPVTDLATLLEGVDGAARAMHAAAERRERAATLDFRARLMALDALAEVLLARDVPEATRLTAAGLPFLATFLRSTTLEPLIARELPSPAALERFVPAGGRKSIRLVPRGVACHWIAGNVPLLGLFSWALSVLVGNVNVIRLSSRQDDLLSPILGRFAALSDAGAQLAAETLLVRFDRDDRAAHEALSLGADVRIAWGGKEAVESVAALPARWDCETLLLGPRVSLAVVDPAVVSDRMLVRLATDVAFFDQQACSSPQVAFVKGRAGTPAFDGFVEHLAGAFAAQSRAFPRHTLDAGETYRIVLDRARVALEGGALRHDQETQWTLALLDRPDGRVACANRFLQVVPFEALDEIYEHIPGNVQTVVTALDGADTATFTEAAARCGVCRFPRPGEGNHFEDPWDGIPVVSRLVRWVVRTDAPAA
jgi:acyl-CoA reductase-like NAD-dependent aldehyde dehydrogenase